MPYPYRNNQLLTFLTQTNVIFLLVLHKYIVDNFQVVTYLLTTECLSRKFSLFLLIPSLVIFDNSHVIELWKNLKRKCLRLSSWKKQESLIFDKAAIQYFFLICKNLFQFIDFENFSMFDRKILLSVFQTIFLWYLRKLKSTFHLTCHYIANSGLSEFEWTFILLSCSTYY